MLFFLHIPKTAGTTFYDVVKKNYPKFIKPKIGKNAKQYLDKSLTSESKVAIRLPGGYNTSQEVLKEILKLPVDKQNRIGFIGGHVGYGLHEHCDAKVDYISFIRDPEKRIISDYKEHCKPGRFFYEELKKSDFQCQKYIELLKKNNLDNLMTRQLAGPYNFFEKERNEVSDILLAQALLNCQNISFFDINKFNEGLLYISRKFKWNRLRYDLKNKAIKVESEIDHKLFDEVIKYDRIIYEKIKVKNSRKFSSVGKIIFMIKSNSFLNRL